jgi:hypothetical protein
MADIAHGLRMTIAVNALGLPAVAVPVGVAGRLPQSVQVIGPATEKTSASTRPKRLSNNSGRSPQYRRRPDQDLLANAMWAFTDPVRGLVRLPSAAADATLRAVDNRLVRMSAGFLVALLLSGMVVVALDAIGLATGWSVVIGWVVFLILGTILGRRRSGRHPA